MTEDVTPTAAHLEARLRQRLAPTALEVIDESHMHAGHVGANDTGVGTHFRVRITSPNFAGKSRVACHRLVYDSVQDFINQGLHALAIETDTPGAAPPALSRFRPGTTPLPPLPSTTLPPSGSRMKKQILVATATAVLLFMAGSAMAQNIAIVNGRAVPASRMEALAQQVAKSGRPVTPDMQGQLKEEIIAREIFAQAAQAQGLDATDDFKTQMELMRQSLMIRELFASFQAKNPVTDAEVKAEYDKFAAANSGKEYKARHILVEKEDQAKAIIAQLKKGGKFDEIAKKASKDPGSGAKGGELDWANPSSYVKEFSEALVALEKGKTTETPVKSQFGFHIIRLDDVREAPLPKLDDVKPQIAQQLMQQKMGKYQEELRSKAKVE